MQGDSILVDPVTGEEVSREQLAGAWRKWRWMVGTMKEIDSGFIHMTMRDYLKLPPMFRTIRTMYCDIRDAYTKEQ